MHVTQLFPGSTCFLNSSDRYYGSACSSSIAQPAVSRSFYRELLDFGSELKKPLGQLLCEYSSDFGSGSEVSFVIVLSNIPASFCDWFLNQLWFLREGGFQLNIRIVLLCDALPCSWTTLRHLRGSRLDAPRFDMFRSNTVCFNPCVLAAFTSQRKVFCVLKKIRIVTFTTAGRGSSSSVICSLWREQLLTPPQASPRLIVDYAAHDDLSILAIAQVCAYRMDMHIQEPAVRSFSSTRGDRRKLLYLDFDSGRPEQEVVDVFRSELSRRNFQHVAIGCVGLFQLPRDSFILTYNSLDWIDDSCISELIDSVVLVSGFKAVIKLNLSSTVDELKMVLEAFAAKNLGGVRQLLDNSARQIWAERLHHRPKLTKDQKCRQTSQARAISLDSLLQFCPESTILVNSLGGGGAGR